MPDLAALIREKYLQTLDQIASGARKAGRNPESIQLVVVSKSQPIQVVAAAVAAGIRIFGENYAEEAIEKMTALNIQSAVEWHMIGHVQSRKARLVAEHFALFHSLDSLTLARRLDGLAAGLGRTLPVLLECNVGGEASKYGWPASDESHWPVLLEDFSSITELASLKVEGLMTMPPLLPEAEAVRPFFQRLRRLGEYLQNRMPQIEWKELSMGTSADYRIAVEEGATLVRVGQAILGARPRRGAGSNVD